MQFSLLAPCLLAVTACGGDSQAPIPGLSVRARPTQIADNGEKARLLIEANDGAGHPLSGTVTLTAASGRFDTNNATARVDVADGGEGEVTFSCATATDPTCEGQVRIEARWRKAASFSFRSFA